MQKTLLKAYGFLGVAGFCLLLATEANAAKAIQVKLVGQDNILFDRQAIQEAIDSAPNKDLVVKLRGTFQLDGTDIQITRSDLIIKGDRQGATLNGLIDEITGFPVLPDEPDEFTGNRGFVLGRSGPLENIEIKDLTLTGMRFAILADGASNPVDNVSIKDLTIRNVIFGVAADQVSDIEINNNTMRNVFRGVDAIQVSDIETKNNHISDASGVAYWLTGVTGAAIKGNFVSVSDDGPAIPVPVRLDGTLIDIDVSNNKFQGGVAALLLWGSATNVIVTENCIRDGGTQGPDLLYGGGIMVGDPVFSTLSQPGSGFVIENNSYADNTWSFNTPTSEPRDIWLTSIAEDNAILEDDGTIVKEEGINNSVVLHGGGDPGFCD